jgi:AcrR family transcriptional regulator
MNDRSMTEPTAIMLLDAVERILTGESPSSVSMRAIATEADASLGLADDYFTSKDELIGAAFDRMASPLIAAETVSTDADYGTYLTVNNRLLPDEDVESHQQGWLMFLAHLQPTNKTRSRQHNR